MVPDRDGHGAMSGICDSVAGSSERCRRCAAHGRMVVAMKTETQVLLRGRIGRASVAYVGPTAVAGVAGVGAAVATVETADRS